MSKKFTRWFPGSVAPVRHGVYARQWPDDKLVGYSLWNGRQWNWMDDSPYFAARNKRASTNQGMRWRGLAKEPKK
jgi:hypothetical protein